MTLNSNFWTSPKTWIFWNKINIFFSQQIENTSKHVGCNLNNIYNYFRHVDICSYFFRNLSPKRATKLQEKKQIEKKRKHFVRENYVLLYLKIVISEKMRSFFFFLNTTHRIWKNHLNAPCCNYKNLWIWRFDNRLKTRLTRYINKINNYIIERMVLHLGIIEAR